jgi:hypothetical protein
MDYRIYSNSSGRGTLGCRQVQSPRLPCMFVARSPARQGIDLAVDGAAVCRRLTSYPSLSYPIQPASISLVGIVREIAQYSIRCIAPVPSSRGRYSFLQAFNKPYCQFVRFKRWNMTKCYSIFTDVEMFNGNF